MVLTRERFERGMTYDEFKAQMTRNQERFTANERDLTLDPVDRSAFTNLPHLLNVLVLAEDWSGDVIGNLPILGRIAAESGKLTLRIFLRDQNLDLMDQYLNQGQFRSIPVFVFFDEQFNELGRFIERPASVTERRKAQRREFHAQHPEFGSPETPFELFPEEMRVKLSEGLAPRREETRAIDSQEVVSALRVIVTQARGQR